jgi:3-phenylpropionate/trans-cinnamate dioxygenase ferredoxin reductase component
MSFITAMANEKGSTNRVRATIGAHPWRAHGELVRATAPRRGRRRAYRRALERIRHNGRVTSIELASGKRIACDEVVVGIGVSPATTWPADSGLLSPGGAAIDADHAGRTAVPHVFAAGDCAGGQHWEAAVQQGAAAAQAMLGDDPPERPPASFWSDLYGTRLNWLGNSSGADDITLDGDPSARDFSAVYCRAGRPVAGLLVGRPRALPELRRLLDRTKGRDR